MLKGERTESYLAQDGTRYTVCELCFVRAEHTGWIRESANGEAPARTARPQERRPLLGRLRRRTPDVLNGDSDAADAEPPAHEEPPPEPMPPPRQRPREASQDPRHVRAVPTTAEVKVQRGLELFNASGHQRTVAGLARSLGAPWAAALADLEAPSTVNLVVAWELSWYRYRIDLGDASEPVSLAEKGDEIAGIDEALQVWNTALDADGRLVIGVAEQ